MSFSKASMNSSPHCFWPQAINIVYAWVSENGFWYDPDITLSLSNSNSGQFLANQRWPLLTLPDTFGTFALMTTAFSPFRVNESCSLFITCLEWFQFVFFQWLAKIKIPGILSEVIATPSLTNRKSNWNQPEGYYPHLHNISYSNDLEMMLLLLQL